MLFAGLGWAMELNHVHIIFGIAVTLTCSSRNKNTRMHNGRRHISSSMHEVSRDLIVHSDSKKKQALLIEQKLDEAIKRLEKQLAEDQAALLEAKKGTGCFSFHTN